MPFDPFFYFTRDAYPVKTVTPRCPRCNCACNASRCHRCGKKV